MRVDYYEYIQSPEWRKKADAAKRRAGYRCQVCNRSSREVQLNAHHRTYKRLGREKPEDITVLCRRCHKIYHEYIEAIGDDDDEDEFGDYFGTARKYEDRSSGKPVKGSTLTSPSGESHASVSITRNNPLTQPSYPTYRNLRRLESETTPKRYIVETPQEDLVKHAVGLFLVVLVLVGGLMAFTFAPYAIDRTPTVSVVGASPRIYSGPDYACYVSTHLEAGDSVTINGYTRTEGKVWYRLSFAEWIPSESIESTASVNSLNVRYTDYIPKCTKVVPIATSTPRSVYVSPTPATVHSNSPVPASTPTPTSGRWLPPRS